MGSTLTNGIYLPAEGERNCYTGLAANWSALDSLIGGYNAHIGNTTIHVTAEEKETWNGKADNSALTAHTENTTIHVTAEDKAKWDAVTSKADDSDVVHKSGNETVGGEKTFNDLQIISYGTQYKGERNAYILPEFSAGSSGLSITTLSFGKSVKIGNFVLDANNKPSLDTSKGYLQIATGTNNGVNTCILEPRNTTSSSLGTSLTKWSTINGVEPSSLSLPGGKANNVIDISSYITNLDGTANSYTVPANGWISIAVVGTAIAIISSSWSDSRLRASSGNVRMLYPVLKNETLAISVTGTTLTYARFIPCQGNV